MHHPVSYNTHNYNAGSSDEDEESDEDYEEEDEGGGEEEPKPHVKTPVVVSEKKKIDLLNKIFVDNTEVMIGDQYVMQIMAYLVSHNLGGVNMQEVMQVNLIADEDKKMKMMCRIGHRHMKNIFDKIRKHDYTLEEGQQQGGGRRKRKPNLRERLRLI
jgi:hypothetical protein